MRVVVLPSAEHRLRLIIDYYRAVAGARVAARIKQRLMSRLRDLERSPRSGALEDLLAGEGKGHRRLVEGNYKIIYWIDGDTIVVTDFFDARRDPLEMKAE